MNMQHLYITSPAAMESDFNRSLSFRGIPVGNIIKSELNSEGTGTIMVAYIKKSVKIPKDSRFTQEIVEGKISGFGVQIEPGNSSSYLSNGDTIAVIPILQKESQTINQLLGQFSTAAKDLKEGMTTAQDLIEQSKAKKNTK